MDRKWRFVFFRLFQPEGMFEKGAAKILPRIFSSKNLGLFFGFYPSKLPHVAPGCTQSVVLSKIT